MKPEGQRNAASKREVEAAGRRARDIREQELAALRAVLATVPGRLVVWRLLERAGVFESVMAPDGVIQYKAGRQDFGHELMSLVEQADDAALFTMMRESKAEREKQARATAATATRSTGDGDDA